MTYDKFLKSVHAQVVFSFVTLEFVCVDAFILTLSPNIAILWFVFVFTWVLVICSRQDICMRIHKEEIIALIKTVCISTIVSCRLCYTIPFLFKCSIALSQ